MTEWLRGPVAIPPRGPRIPQNCEAGKVQGLERQVVQLRGRATVFLGSKCRGGGESFWGVLLGRGGEQAWLGRCANTRGRRGGLTPPPRRLSNCYTITRRGGDRDPPLEERVPDPPPSSSPLCFPYKPWGGGPVRDVVVKSCSRMSDTLLGAKADRQVPPDAPPSGRKAVIPWFLNAIEATEPSRPGRLPLVPPPRIGAPLPCPRSPMVHPPTARTPPLIIAGAGRGRWPAAPEPRPGARGPAGPGQAAPAPGQSALLRHPGLRGVRSSMRNENSGLIVAGGSRLCPFRYISCISPDHSNSKTPAAFFLNRTQQNVSLNRNL